MNTGITFQYDGLGEKFIEGTDIYNESSRAAYYSMLDFGMNNKVLLDVGCGDGYDLSRFQGLGAQVFGIDASILLLQRAKEKVPKARLVLGLMEELPFRDSFFDVVLSKYVLQTSNDVPRVLKEMDRVLKVGGIMAYLTTHPTRQFLEKKKHPKDYFLQELVESIFFNGTVSIREPTHTMNEYLNREFLKKYRVTFFKEQGDFPSSEKVDGDNYPCYFILSAEKASD